MSILKCPVCQGAMSEVNRNGVLIDTCTQCRGVWLDRGELEKLASMVDDGRHQYQQQSGFFAGAPVTSAPPPRPYRHDDDDDDDDRRYRHYGDRHYGKHKKSKMARLMDFFD